MQGKVVVVTGAAKGIGDGIAKAFGEAGASVVVNYARSADDANNVVRHIEASGGTAIAVQADVSDRKQVAALFSAAKAKFGALDVLVNNAGQFKFEPFESASSEALELQFRVNVFGTFYAIQEALAYFGPRGGSVINIGSIAGANPALNMAAYASSKGAIDSLTQALARELGPKGIRVNAINPGHTNTEGIASIGGFSGDFGKMLVAGTPLGRLGEPADIAPAAVFLASDAAHWITGECIRVSGGAHGIGY